MTKKIMNYRDLNIWRKGMDLVDKLYEDTAELPKEEMYGITSQMRRAAVSVPSNIAEGHAKRRGKYFAVHLDTALGSLAELDTLTEVCMRRKFLGKKAVQARQEEIQELQRMVRSLQDKVPSNY